MSEDDIAEYREEDARERAAKRRERQASCRDGYCGALDCVRCHPNLKFQSNPE